VKTVYKKLQDVRVAFNNLNLKKSGVNTYAKYTYFELADFIPKVQELMQKNGLCAIISFKPDLAIMTIYEFEGDGVIEITSPSADAATKGTLPIQSLGSAQTYLRRYLWMVALEITEHDAIDSQKPVDKQEIKKPEGITPLAGAMDALSPELQELAKEVVENINGYMMLNGVDQAVNTFKMAYMNDDQTEDVDIKNAIWSQLDSKTRAAMKKFNQEKGAK
jgi:hypothetical protein